MSRRDRGRSEDPSVGLRRLLEEVWGTRLTLLGRATNSREERRPLFEQGGRERTPPRYSRWDRREPLRRRIIFSPSLSNIDSSACSGRVQHVAGVQRKRTPNPSTSHATASGMHGKQHGNLQGKQHENESACILIPKHSTKPAETKGTPSTNKPLLDGKPAQVRISTTAVNATKHAKPAIAVVNNTMATSANPASSSLLEEGEILPEEEDRLLDTGDEPPQAGASVIKELEKMLGEDQLLNSLGWPITLSQIAA